MAYYTFPVGFNSSCFFFFFHRDETKKIRAAAVQSPERERETIVVIKNRLTSSARPSSTIFPPTEPSAHRLGAASSIKTITQPAEHNSRMLETAGDSDDGARSIPSCCCVADGPVIFYNNNNNNINGQEHQLFKISS